MDFGDSPLSGSGDQKGVTTFERSKLKNVTHLRKALKKLLDPSVTSHLIIAAGWNPVDYEMGNPWATPSEFNSQVHRELA